MSGRKKRTVIELPTDLYEEIMRFCAENDITTDMFFIMAAGKQMEYLLEQLRKGR